MTVPEQVTKGDSQQLALYTATPVRLLVLDDDPAIGRLIQAAFAAHGFQVDAVSEINRMLAAVGEQTYHVIILDYVLPGLDSTQIIAAIRSQQPEASIIVVTAFPSIDSALQCLRAHTDDYITKPFDIDHLKKIVLRSLESRGLLRLSEEALREQLGAAMRERRKALGLTLAEVAERSGLSLGYLFQIELGKSSASIEALYRIALSLRIPLAQLFEGIQSAPRT